MITIAVCGCGNRGLYAYTQYQLECPDRLKVVAGADIRPERLELLKNLYNVSEEMCFVSDEALLSMPKLADAMLIATPDQMHVDEALKALDLGYHLILEKPISPNLAKCLKLQDKVHETGKFVTVCHVLRYSIFYKEIEKLVRNKVIGDIKTINMTENVGYWHYCHSFVRGNWRNSNETSPMILQKSCHDMDLFRWLAGEKCLRVQSFGSLSYFNHNHKPEGSADRCPDCKYKSTCQFSAERIYITDERTGVLHVGDEWPVQVVVENPTEEKVRAALKYGPYGRCVFACDNNVVDHQTLNMEFENNIYGTFSMSAFSDENYRTIKITGTAGELYGRLDDFKITLRKFGEPEEILDFGKMLEATTGHGGGDEGLAAAFCDLLEGKESSSMTSVDVSVESHVMALAAEASRLQGGKTIELDEFVSSVG